MPDTVSATTRGQRVGGPHCTSPKQNDHNLTTPHLQAARRCLARDSVQGTAGESGAALLRVGHTSMWIDSARIARPGSGRSQVLARRRTVLCPRTGLPVDKPPISASNERTSWITPACKNERILSRAVKSLKFFLGLKSRGCRSNYSPSSKRDDDVFASNASADRPPSRPVALCLGLWSVILSCWSSLSVPGFGVWRQTAVAAWVIVGSFFLSHVSVARSSLVQPSNKPCHRDAEGVTNSQ